MLEGLNDIDWSSLRHAYGSAEDVPDLLRALTSPDAETRKEAFGEFFGNIYHQGTVYQASAYATPFLISLLREPAIADKWHILVLLASLAEGTSYHDIHGFWQPSKDDETTLKEELNWVRKTRQAVARGAPVYLSLLTHQDVQVRQTAPIALARSLVRDRQAAAQLMLRAREEPEDLARASILLGIGSLAEPMDQACITFLTDQMTTRAPLVRMAAALALRRAGGEGVLAQVLPVVLESAGPALEPAKHLIWMQMHGEFFSQVNGWLDAPPEVHFDFFRNLIDRTTGPTRASALYAFMEVCNRYPEIAPLSPQRMRELLADECREVRRNMLWLLDDVPAARGGMLPALIEMANRTHDTRELQSVAKVICHYPDPSLAPVLAGFLRQTLSTNVIKALGALGPAAASEAPLLVQILDASCEQHPHMVKANALISAALALGDMGAPVAKVAVPALIRTLEAGHAKRAVPQALGKFGPLARAAEPVLLLASQEGDPCERAFAALALWQIDAWPARVAAESLTRLLQMAERREKSVIAGILARMGPLARVAVQPLRDLLREPDSFSQFAAAVALWKINHDTADTLPAFARSLTDGGGELTFECLGEMGSTARHLLPELKAALARGPRTRVVGSDCQVTFRNAAAEAIRRIEAAVNET